MADRVVLEFVAKMKGAVASVKAGVARMQASAKKLTFKTAQKGVERVNKGLIKSESLIGRLGVAAAAFGAARFFKGSTEALIEQTDAVADLDAALESTGETAGFTSEQLQEMARSLQGVTTFGDEAIIPMQSVLLTFTNIKETLPETTEAVLNIATRMKTDLRSAALQVGKALNDPIKGLDGLGRAGIQFSESQKAVIKDLATTGRVADAQRLILKELETQFGGAARAARDTLGGSLKALGNTFGDLQETFAGGFLGEFEGDIEDADEKLKDLTESVGTLGKALALAVKAQGFLFGPMIKGLDVALGLFESASEKVKFLVSDIDDLTEGMRSTGEETAGTKKPLEELATSAEKTGKDVKEKLVKPIKEATSALKEFKDEAGVSDDVEDLTEKQKELGEELEILQGSTKLTAEETNRLTEVNTELWQVEQDLRKATQEQTEAVVEQTTAVGDLTDAEVDFLLRNEEAGKGALASSESFDEWNQSVQDGTVWVDEAAGALSDFSNTALPDAIGEIDKYSDANLEAIENLREYGGVLPEVKAGLEAVAAESVDSIASIDAVTAAWDRQTEAIRKARLEQAKWVEDVPGFVAAANKVTEALN